MDHFRVLCGPPDPKRVLQHYLPQPDIVRLARKPRLEAAVDLQP